MAAPLSRPDPTSPASVAEAGFNTARRGYHPDEVRAFLVSVSTELRRLQERERQLEAELRNARVAPSGPAELDEATVAALLGEETVRVLQAARESASQIKIRAEDSAARVLRDAHDEANRLRQEAEVDAARRRADAQGEVAAEVAQAKQQGREMVNEARAYRERVLADLERRTKLARQHIEELAQGRERLLQVFERARLVAVDVASDLQSFVGPDEFVNFSPTTGPVPLLVPGAKLDASDDEFDELIAEPTVDATRAIDAVLAAELHGEDASADTTAEPDDGAAATDIDAGGAATDDAAIDDAAIDDAATDDAATDEAEADDAPANDAAVSDAEPVTAARDTNVVALFRGGAPDTEPAKTDVDGLFARLRNEVPSESGVADAGVDDVAESEAAADESPTVEQAPTAFTRRDEAIVPLIVTAARKLKRVLADEQNGVLDTLRKREPVTSLDAIVPKVTAHAKTYLDAIADELGAAAAAGAAELGARDTATLRRSLAKAGALDGARAHVTGDLVGALRERLERSIADGGGDNDAVTRRARAVYREWKTQHIDDQLDDVFRHAFGGGLAVTASPGTPMIWTLDPGEPACADCEDNSLAGEVSAGESFPTGHTSAPAHPGCRCLTLPARQ
jgi:DivIVA domain-containing protein